MRTELDPRDTRGPGDEGGGDPPFALTEPFERDGAQPSAPVDAARRAQERLRALEEAEAEAQRSLAARRESVAARAGLEAALAEALADLGAEALDALRRGPEAAADWARDLSAALPASRADADSGAALELPPPIAHPEVETEGDGEPPSEPADAPSEPVASLPIEPPRPTMERAVLVSRPREHEPVDVSEATLRLLSSRMQPTLGQKGKPTRGTNEAETRGVIKEALEVFGRAPAGIKSKKRVQREVETLEVGLERLLVGWARLPPLWTRRLIGWVTARAREAQAVAEKQGATDWVDRVSRLFPKLSEFSAREQPGFVYGLARSHTPVGDRWLDDAHEVEATLVALADGDVGIDGEPEAPPPEDPDRRARARLDNALRRLTEEVRDGLDAEDFEARVLELVRKGLGAQETRLVNLARTFDGAQFSAPELTPTRRAVEALIEAEADADAPAEVWPFVKLTRGRTALIVGGDARQTTIDRLQAAGQFAQVEWIGDLPNSPRQLQSLEQRIRAGGIDFVLVLVSFVSHATTEKLVPLDDPASTRVVVAEGYGMGRLRLAFERLFFEGNATR